MSHLDPDETIAAIATPSGPAVRGMVRVTGPEAFRICREGFEPNHKTKPTRGATLVEGWLRLENQQRPLRVSTGFWPGPRTYTGQAMAEIHGSGSPPILRKILAHCLAGGARLAEPGEFTLRAFLSGRIDLTQSEAVLGVIDAGTPAQLEAALRQLAGGLASPIRDLRDRLADVLAHLEANLDFAEESDVEFLENQTLAASLDEEAVEITRLSKGLRGRERPEGRPRVVLVGPPNAGKSRLFNALAGNNRAIVSPVAGTTRDYLEARCDCSGLSLDLVDTAGEEQPWTDIESRAQTARGGQAALADLVLICQSSDTIPPDPVDGPSLRVWTKSDRAPMPDAGRFHSTSASTGEGIEALKQAISQAIQARPIEADLPTGTAVRCRASLETAAVSLATAAESLRDGLGAELVAVDLRQAMDDLGRVVGAVMTDDLLDRIFRRFCIGK